MKRHKAFCLLLCCLLFSACQSRGVDETVFAMDTAVTFRLFGEHGRAAAEEAKRELVRLESLLDAEGETLQALSSGEGVYQPELVSLLARVREIEDATGGALDVTVYPAVRAWGFIDGAYRVPDEKELASLKPFVDYHQVSLDGAHISLPAGFSLTLGAVAKGYAAECLAAVCRASGVESGVLSLGGNVRLIGDKAGEPWKVAVRAPGGGNALTLALADVSVVTSGSYERYFEADGHVYHHILDPKTLSPAENTLQSVTVVAADGLLADALSTALFVMGRDAAVAYYAAHGAADGFEMVLLTDDGSVYITENLREKLVSVSESYENVITVGKE